MFVDSQSLHSGGRESQRAGEHTQQAAEHLSREILPAQMFGDFVAADAFHEAIHSAHAHHVRKLLTSNGTLVNIGHTAHLAAAGFSDMDENNATTIRAVWCNSAT